MNDKNELSEILEIFQKCSTQITYNLVLLEMLYRVSREKYINKSEHFPAIYCNSLSSNYLKKPNDGQILIPGLEFDKGLHFASFKDLLPSALNKNFVDCYFNHSHRKNSENDAIALKKHSSLGRKSLNPYDYRSLYNYPNSQSKRLQYLILNVEIDKLKPPNNNKQIAMEDILEKGNKKNKMKTGKFKDEKVNGIFFGGIKKGAFLFRKLFTASKCVAPKSQTTSASSFSKVCECNFVEKEVNTQITQIGKKTRIQSLIELSTEELDSLGGGSHYNIEIKIPKKLLCKENEISAETSGDGYTSSSNSTIRDAEEKSEHINKTNTCKKRLCKAYKEVGNAEKYEGPTKKESTIYGQCVCKIVSSVTKSKPKDIPPQTKEVGKVNEGQYSCNKKRMKKGFRKKDESKFPLDNKEKKKKKIGKKSTKKSITNGSTRRGSSIDLKKDAKKGGITEDQEERKNMCDESRSSKSPTRCLRGSSDSKTEKKNVTDITPQPTAKVMEDREKDNQVRKYYCADSRVTSCLCSIDSKIEKEESKVKISLVTTQSAARGVIKDHEELKNVCDESRGSRSLKGSFDSKNGKKKSVTDVTSQPSPGGLVKDQQKENQIGKNGDTKFSIKKISVTNESTSGSTDPTDAIEDLEKENQIRQSVDKEFNTMEKSITNESTRGSTDSIKEKKKITVVTPSPAVVYIDATDSNNKKKSEKSLWRKYKFRKKSQSTSGEDEQQKKRWKGKISKKQYKVDVTSSSEGEISGNTKNRHRRIKKKSKGDDRSLSGEDNRPQKRCLEKKKTKTKPQPGVTSTSEGEEESGGTKMKKRQKSREKGNTSGEEEFEEEKSSEVDYENDHAKYLNDITHSSLVLNFRKPTTELRTSKFKKVDSTEAEENGKEIVPYEQLRSIKMTELASEIETKMESHYTSEEIVRDERKDRSKMRRRPINECKEEIFAKQKVTPIKMSVANVISLRSATRQVLNQQSLNKILFFLYQHFLSEISVQLQGFQKREIEGFIKRESQRNPGSSRNKTETSVLPESKKSINPCLAGSSSVNKERCNAKREGMEGFETWGASFRNVNYLSETSLQYVDHKMNINDTIGMLNCIKDNPSDIKRNNPRLAEICTYKVIAAKKLPKIIYNKQFSNESVSKKYGKRIFFKKKNLNEEQVDNCSCKIIKNKNRNHCGLENDKNVSSMFQKSVDFFKILFRRDSKTNEQKEVDNHKVNKNGNDVRVFGHETAAAAGVNMTHENKRKSLNDLGQPNADCYRNTLLEIMKCNIAKKTSTNMLNAHLTQKSDQSVSSVEKILFQTNEIHESEFRWFYFLKSAHISLHDIFSKEKCIINKSVIKEKYRKMRNSKLKKNAAKTSNKCPKELIKTNNKRKIKDLQNEGRIFKKRKTECRQKNSIENLTEFNIAKYRSVFKTFTEFNPVENIHQSNMPDKKVYFLAVDKVKIKLKNHK